MGFTEDRAAARKRWLEEASFIEGWLRSPYWLRYMKPKLEKVKLNAIEKLCNGTESRDEDQLLRGVVRTAHEALQQPESELVAVQRKLKALVSEEQQDNDSEHLARYGRRSPYVDPETGDESGDDDE